MRTTAFVLTALVVLSTPFISASAPADTTSSVYLIGEQDYADGDTIDRNAPWLEAQQGEGPPCEIIWQDPETMTWTHKGLGSSVLDGTLTFSLWDLDSYSPGCQACEFYLNGVAQDASIFENPQVPDLTVKIYSVEVDPALLQNDSLRVDIVLVSNEGNQVGVDFSRLDVRRVETCLPDTALAAGGQYRRLFAIYNNSEVSTDFVYILTGDSALAFASEDTPGEFSSQIVEIVTIAPWSVTEFPVWMRVDPEATVGSTLLTRFEAVNTLSTQADTCYSAVTVESVVSSVAESGRANRVFLFPAYPNPFNPMTTINYSVSKPTKVRVAVYDIKGRVARELAKGVVEPGVHEVQWDGHDSDGVPVSSGVYFVRLVAGGQHYSRKLVLLK